MKKRNNGKYNNEYECYNFTFSYLVEKWRELKKSSLAQKTQERYESILVNFILPTFGDKKICEIKALDIEEYINKLQKNGIRNDGKKGGYSQKTISHHYALLHRLFTLGVNWEITDRNPCDKIDKPKVDFKEADFYEMKALNEMLKYLECEKLMYKVYVWIALSSSCRRSEVLGLEFDDIDFSSNVIKVCRTSQYTKQIGIYTVPKLKNGNPSKIITIPIEVVNLIKQYKLERDFFDSNNQATNKNYVKSNRLFINLSGGVMHPDVISVWFQRFLKKNDLPKITLHQVRHTSISYLLNSGVDINTVSERAGHSDVVVTTKIYGHIFNKNKRESADKFSSLFKTALLKSN